MSDDKIATEDDAPRATTEDIAELIGTSEERVRESLRRHTEQPDAEVTHHDSKTVVIEVDGRTWKGTPEEFRALRKALNGVTFHD